VQDPAIPVQRGGRHRKPATPGAGTAAITTGAFALVPFALSSAPAAADEIAPAVSSQTITMAAVQVPAPAMTPVVPAPAAVTPVVPAQATAPAIVPAPAAISVPTVDWGPIMKCESGGNPRAQNSGSTASGLYQFLDSSWKAYGGGKYSARAKDASVAEQTEVANAAFRRSGLTPWKASQHCWGGKVRTGGPATRPASKPKPAAPAIPALPALPNPARILEVSAPAPGAPNQPAVGGDIYQVKPGDSLARIAASRGLSWQSVWEANKGSVARPNLLHPGETLQMPKLPGQL
jgi:LysM repeat protein